MNDGISRLVINAIATTSRSHLSSRAHLVLNGRPARAYRGSRQMCQATARLPLRPRLEDEVERRFGGSAHATEPALLENLREPRLARLRS